MALLRLSVIKDTVYAPFGDGTLSTADYNRRQRRGKMEAIPEGTYLNKGSAVYHYLRTQAWALTSGLDDAQPVVILVHGFLFDPKQAVSTDPKETDNPHGRLYHFKLGRESEEIRHHTSSWPLGLGFEEDDVDGRTGLAIAFGWNSQPGFASSIIDHFQNFYARAYDMAGKSAWVLLNIILMLRDILPGKRIDVFCHSLGSRVVVRALAQLFTQRPQAATCVGNVICLGGAEYVVEAQLMVRRMRQIQDADLSFYNVVSRENDVLDKLAENFGPRTFGNSQVIGHNGLDVGRPGNHWIDMQIDGAKLQKWMEDHRGQHVSGDRPDNVWDHWYYYTYRSNMSLYQDILRHPERWRITDLRAQRMPDRVSKRWSIFGD